MKKPLIIFAVVLVATGVFVLGCHRSAQPSAHNGTMIIGMENDVPTFDTLKLGNVFALRVASEVFEGLTRLNESNQIVGAVADSWDHSQDFKAWTFHLRNGVMFQPNPDLNETNRSLTAADVVYSFTRMLSKDAVTAGPLSSELEGAKDYQDGKATSVSGIHIVSPEQVEFVLTTPDSLFPGRISSPAYGIVKKAVVEAAGPNFGQTVAVGTGPFQFVERQGNDLILKRYDQYWGPKSEIDTAIFRTVKEDAVRLAQAKAGQLDVTYATPPMLDGLVEKTNDILRVKAGETKMLSLLSYPVFDTYFLAFNYPKVDPDLRRAIALAVDRDQIVSAVVPLTGISAAGPVPLACAGYDTQVKATALHLDAAKAALNVYREKHPGETPKLEILTCEVGQSTQIGEVLQSQLKQIGIEVDLQQVSFNAVVQHLQKGDFQSVAIFFEYQYSLPQLILQNFFTTAAVPLPNVFYYNKPENDAAIATLFTTGDEKVSLEQAAEVEKKLVDDAPGVFLYQTRQVILLNPNLQGVEFNGANFPILTHASWK